MKKVLFLVLSLGMSSLLVADDTLWDINKFEEITVTTTTVIKPSESNFVDRSHPSATNGTKYLFVTVEDDNIRWRVDGSSPTASSGHVVTAGGNFTVTGYDNVRNLRMIGSGSASAGIKVSFGIEE